MIDKYLLFLILLMFLYFTFLLSYPYYITLIPFYYTHTHTHTHTHTLDVIQNITYIPIELINLKSWPKYKFTQMHKVGPYSRNSGFED